MCSCNFYFIRFFFYLGRAPREVEEFQVTADSSEILKKAGEMNKGILHDNLLSLSDLSDYYDVAESNENIGDTMIPNTSPNITFGVSEVSSNGIASRAAARLLVQRLQSQSLQPLPPPGRGDPQRPQCRSL